MHSAQQSPGQLLTLYKEKRVADPRVRESRHETLLSARLTWRLGEIDARSAVFSSLIRSF